MTPTQVLLRAAQLLDEDAQALKESHTRGDGTWDLSAPEDETAKAGHDERLQIAAKLTVMARATCK